MVEDHYLQAMKIVHHFANDCIDWLISGQQSGNPGREAISILSEKYKDFAFVNPVLSYLLLSKSFSNSEIVLVLIVQLLYDFIHQVDY